MSGFALKNTQVGVTMTLLVLCLSTCPHSSYPHVEENENPTAAMENLDNEEDQELFHDEDETLEEDQVVLEEATDQENDTTPGSKECAEKNHSCKDRKCCEGPRLRCLTFPDRTKICL